MRWPSRPAACVALTLAAVILLTGCGSPGGATSAAAPASPTSSGFSSSTSPDPSPTEAVPTVEAPSSTPPAVRPTGLRIPAIGVDTDLERLRVGGAGRLRPPVDPDLAGWFPGGAVPGDLGAAVIAGHRDSRTGKAVFWRLTDLREGDRMSVTRTDGTRVQFEVVDVRRVSRSSFPTEDVYGPTPDRTLRLITCGGVYDHVRGRYLDNVLVLALAV